MANWSINYSTLILRTIECADKILLVVVCLASDKLLSFAKIFTTFRIVRMQLADLIFIRVVYAY